MAVSKSAASRVSFMVKVANLSPPTWLMELIAVALTAPLRTKFDAREPMETGEPPGSVDTPSVKATYRSAPSTKPSIL